MCDAPILILFSIGDRFNRSLAASKWIVSQKAGDFKGRCAEYINRVFPSERNVWPQEEGVRQLTEKCMRQKMYGVYPDPEFVLIHDPYAARGIQCGMR